MKIVRNSDFKTNKNIPVSHETVDINTGVNNIVKVQPNNFLNDNKSTANSNHSNSKELDKIINENVSPKSNIIDPSNYMISNEFRICQDVTFTNDNELLNKKNSETDQKLCESMSPRSQASSEKAELEKDRDIKNKDYSSVHIQSATRNILLDNAHNVAPVLYSKSHKIKPDEKAHTTDLGSTVESVSNSVMPILYTRRIQKIKNEAAQTADLNSNVESASSSDDKSNSMSSNTSIQNQQRVAEWIQNNLDNDVSSSDNSRTDSMKNKNFSKVDKVKYAEMEENVKRFLFGESEFLKKVEIGKLKYQNFQDVGPSNSLNKKNSCTETDI